MKFSLLAVVMVCCAAALPAERAAAFCGFYVGKADTDLFNNVSKVVIARHEGHTAITMANDYQGQPTEFALVIPVPTVLERGQIRVSENALIEHLDAYTAPRLVEYFDENPCWTAIEEALDYTAELQMVQPAPLDAEALGVTIVARYSVGEYDILILSAEQSSGLVTWLTENGYRIPAGAERALTTYLAQGMKFFVAKVNLEEQVKLGYTYLRPLQIAFDSSDFMLPIRLGMVNAAGPQELFVFTLTRNGRVETTNYRTERIPGDVSIPLFVKDDFGSFYQAMFDVQVAREEMRVVFLEYAWDMN